MENNRRGTFRYYKKDPMRLSLLIVTLWLTIAACRRPGGETGSAVSPEMEALYGDFVTFYERFHADSAFQMEHILFPLPGVPRNADSTVLVNGFQWQREDWVVHRPVDYANSDFKREFIPFGDDILIEQIRHQRNDLGMIRRWQRSDGDWYLIYYAALNHVGKRGEVLIEMGE